MPHDDWKEYVARDAALYRQRHPYMFMTAQDFESERIQKLREELKAIEDYYHAVCKAILRKDDGGGDNYNPDEPRVPAGSPDGGEWTSGDGGDSGDLVPDPYESGDDGIDWGDLLDDLSKDFGKYLSEGLGALGEGISNLPGEIGQVETDLATNPSDGLNELFGPGGYFGFLGGEGGLLGDVDAATNESAAGGIELTGHGALRATERGITGEEVQDAIQTAQQTGNVISQMGKYGTPQNVYQGSNGVTVVVETTGRNAGKIITLYRQE